MTALRLSGITSYRRFVTEAIILALRDAFGSSYNRDQELVNLHVTNAFPLAQQEYPCIVVSYIDRRVSNAGVGHEEWFYDTTGALRKWHHSRFEGSINLDLYGLSPLDRDTLADGLVDLLRFGRLDAQLNKLFTDLYGDPSAAVTFQVEQLAVNVDEIDGRGNMEQPAPWAAEDQKVYGTGYTLEAHGGFYNTVITDVFEYVSNVETFPYPQGEQQVILDTAGSLSNPFVYFEVGEVRGRGVVSAIES